MQEAFFTERSQIFLNCYRMSISFKVSSFVAKIKIYVCRTYFRNLVGTFKNVYNFTIILCLKRNARICIWKLNELRDSVHYKCYRARAYVRCCSTNLVISHGMKKFKV